MCRHEIHFYDNDFPADEIGTFLAEGMAAGARCVALLDGDHRRALERRLREAGVDLRNPAYASVDSVEFLSMATIGGRLDIARATGLLGLLMQAPASGGGRVRAVGDLAPALHRVGRTDDAVVFENLVHQVATRQDCDFVCAYPINNAGTIDALVRLSAPHGAIRFPPRPWIHHLAS
jgi:hypothetical protein